MAPKNTRSTIINKEAGKNSKTSEDSCVVPGCKAITERSKIVLFSMAFGDLVYWWRSTAWVSKFQMELPENARICEAHFEERFIDRTRKKPRLYPGTVPTLQLGVMEYRQGVEQKDEFESKDYFCRFCAKKEDEPMKHTLNQLVHMPEIVACCMGQHQQQPDLPNGVCNECITVMLKFQQFVKKCDQAQRQLLKMDEELLNTATANKENTAENKEHEFELVDLSMDTEEIIPLQQDELDQQEEAQMEIELVQQEQALQKIEKVKQRCLRCDKDFTNLVQYRNHMKSGHRDEGYECQICNKKFSERSRLRFHLEKVHENRRFKCPECNPPRYFNWQCSLNTHMKVHQYQFNCDDCWRTFPTDEKLQEHRVTHDDAKNFKCLECGTKFKTKWRMEAHKERVHKTLSTVKKYEHVAAAKEEITVTKRKIVVAAAPVLADTRQIDLDEEKIDSARSE
uniref:Putative c2h2-type zn-finger protein n=1 Tax=Culex tarsalis TaxID=7177 RepID=A0A1Q3EZC7_CULTA